VTGSNAFYKFSDVLIPYLYTVVGTNLSTDYEDVAEDYNSVGDGDLRDNGNVVVDGKVSVLSVKLNSAEEDYVRNYFVDKLKK
jgi:hypothetical protein